MFQSLRVARPFGIDVYIHWSFWILPLFILLGNNGFGGVGVQFVLLALVFTCVVLHELGHALAARQYGIGTRHITLTPIGGVAALEHIPSNPVQEFIIAIAGPLVNVAILFGLGALYALSETLGDNLLDTPLGQVGQYLFLVNIMMVLFNMIPAFPMDGGRVLRAVLAGFMDRISATRAAVTVGSVAAVLMGLAGIFYFGNFFLVLIAFMVYQAGHQELNALIIMERQRLYRPTAPADILYIWDPRQNRWIEGSMSSRRDNAI